MKSWLATWVPFIGQADEDDQNSARGLPIVRQRLKFDKYIFTFCETTIEKMLIIAM